LCTSDVRSQQSSLFRSRGDRDFFVCGSASIFRQFPCVMGTCETRRRHRRRFCGLLKKSLEKTLKKKQKKSGAARGREKSPLAVLPAAVGPQGLAAVLLVCLRCSAFRFGSLVFLFYGIVAYGANRPLHRFSGSPTCPSSSTSSLRRRDPLRSRHVASPARAAAPSP